MSAATRRLAVDLGVYLERYRWRPVSIVVDAGVGGERLRDFDGGRGAWERALRLLSQLTLPISAQGALRLELEAYDARVSDVVAPAGGAWRWGSGVALRGAAPVKASGGWGAEFRGRDVQDRTRGE